MDLDLSHVKNVALDGDGVLFDYVRACCDKKGIPLREPTRYDMIEPGLFDSRDEWNIYHTEAMEDAENIPLLTPNTYECVKALHDHGYKLALITARPNFAYDGTCKALEKNGLDKFISEVHFSTHKPQHPEYHILVDDAGYIAEQFDAADTPTQLIIYDHGYNQHVTNYPRITDLDHLAQILLR